jgi:hypothetical protein
MYCMAALLARRKCWKNDKKKLSKCLVLFTRQRVQHGNNGRYSMQSKGWISPFGACYRRLCKESTGKAVHV